MQNFDSGFLFLFYFCFSLTILYTQCHLLNNMKTLKPVIVYCLVNTNVLHVDKRDSAGILISSWIYFANNKSHQCDAESRQESGWGSDGRKEKGVVEVAGRRAQLVPWFLWLCGGSTLCSACNPSKEISPYSFLNRKSYWGSFISMNEIKESTLWQIQQWSGV